MKSTLKKNLILNFEILNIHIFTHLLHLPIFICFSLNLMKDVTKKSKMVQYLCINDLQYVNLCNTALLRWVKKASENEY